MDINQFAYILLLPKCNCFNWKYSLLMIDLLIIFKLDYESEIS